MTCPTIQRVYWSIVCNRKIAGMPAESGDWKTGGTE
jgi:hypothetical protein